MYTKKNTRRALFSSVVALILCFAMLAGTTFAWFTDEVKSGINQINAGNLDVELYHGKTENPTTKVDGNTVLFTDEDDNKIELWEPGVVGYTNLKVANVGTLALKYQMSMNFTNMNYVEYANGKQHNLAEVLKVAVVEGGFSGNREDAHNLTYDYNLSSFDLSGILETKESSATYGIVIYWQPNADDYDNLFNMNNGKTTSDGEALHIDLGINLFATQEMYEEDSFGPNYDGGAKWINDATIGWYLENPNATEFAINSAEELAGLAAIVNGTATSETSTYAVEGEETTTTTTTIHDNFAGKTVKLASNIDLAGKVWTPIGKIGAKTTDFTYAFKGTFDGQNHTISNLKVSNEGWAGVFGIVYQGNIKNLGVAGATINSSRMTGAIVGQIYGSIDNCHVKDVNILMLPNWIGSTYDNGDKVGGVVGWLGDNGNNNHIKGCTATNVTIKAYRDMGGIAGYIGSSSTVEDCKVDTIKLTADQITNAYGAKEVNAGSVVGRIYAEPVTIQNNTEAKVTITQDLATHVKDFAGLKEALAASGSIVLLNDIEQTEKITVPSGVEATLYMNGKTISGTFSGTGNQDMFLVKGNLTVENGSFEMTATQNQGWNAMSTIFDITDGGVVNLENVTADNKGGTDMNFVAHLNNWGEVTLNVNNSNLKATYMPVRVFNSGYDMNNVTIKNSTLDGGNHAFWVHNYIGDLDSSTHSDEAIKARLNFDIYNNGNTFKYGASKVAPVRYGFSNSIYYNAEGKEVVVTLEGLQAKLDAATDGTVITLGTDITGDATVTQKSDVKITIDGDDHTYAGVITVDGKSSRYETAGLTIKNVNFEADTLSADAFIRLGHVDAARYTNNVTVENCTFSGNGFVAVKSYTGGDYNVTLENLTVNEGMHSLAQLKNVEKNLTVTGCKVYSKNGLNVNNGDNLAMSGCTFDVQGYAVRFGSDDGVYDRKFTITESTLKSACAEEGDAVIEFRAGAVKSTLTLTNTTVEGTVTVKGNTSDTVIFGLN